MRLPRHADEVDDTFNVRDLNIVDILDQETKEAWKLRKPAKQKARHKKSIIGAALKAGAKVAFAGGLTKGSSKNSLISLQRQDSEQSQVLEGTVSL